MSWFAVLCCIPRALCEICRGAEITRSLSQLGKPERCCQIAQEKTRNKNLLYINKYNSVLCSSRGRDLEKLEKNHRCWGDCQSRRLASAWQVQEHRRWRKIIPGDAGHPRAPIGTAGGRQAPAPLAATMRTTAARPLSSGTRPRAVDNGWFYVNNSKNN